MNDRNKMTDLDEKERQHYISATYTTLKHPVTGKELQIESRATEVIEIMKKQGYVEVTTNE